MGIALIIPDISFAESNIGRVIPVTPEPLESLEISGPDTISYPNTTGQYIVTYTPPNTAERGVVWSIVTGDEIATIDNNGLLTISGGGTIKIRATSQYNQSIYAEKTITAQAFIPIEDLTNRLNFPRDGGYIVTDIILDSGDYIKMKFERFSNIQLSFFVGSRQLSNADQDSTTIEVSTAGKLFVKLFGKKFEAANALTLQTRYVITAKESGISCVPSIGNFIETSYAYTRGYPLCIDGILYANNTVGYYGGSGDIFGIEIYGSNDQLKHRLIPQSDLTFLDEITNVVYSKTGGGTINYGTD